MSTWIRALFRGSEADAHSQACCPVTTVLECKPALRFVPHASLFCLTCLLSETTATRLQVMAVRVVGRVVPMLVRPLRPPPSLLQPLQLRSLLLQPRLPLQPLRRVAKETMHSFSTPFCTCCT